MDNAVREAIANSFVSIRAWNEYERRLMECDTLSGIREYVRNEIEEARPRPSTRAARPCPATYDEIIDDLSIASGRVQQFGATRAQIETIARLAVRNGLTLDRISMNTLTRREATNIISTF